MTAGSLRAAGTSREADWHVPPERRAEDEKGPRLTRPPGSEKGYKDKGRGMYCHRSNRLAVGAVESERRVQSRLNANASIEMGFSRRGGKSTPRMTSLRLTVWMTPSQCFLRR